MNLDRYRNALENGDHYRTPGTASRHLPDRWFGGLDAWYYIGLFSIVLRGARHARRGTYSRSFWIGQSLATWNLVEACGGRLDIRGLDRVRAQSGPRVYVANHMSLLETFLLPAICAAADPVAIVVKEQLLRTPFFGSIMRAVNPISVTRTNAREDLRTVLAEGAAALAQGRSVLVFPQSTRLTAFDPSAFNSLGAKLADRAGVPLQPIALKTDFMGIGRWMKDFGRIDRSQTVFIEVAPAMDAQGRLREAQQETIRFITDHLVAWGCAIRPPERPT